MDFKQKLLNVSHKNNSLLCIGLDIDREKMPKFLFETSENPYFDFNRSIINATKDIVCAYKLNMAFYEIFGSQGISLMQQTIKFIPNDIIIILDGKRNDIGNTALKYAQTLYKTFNADAATINPYLGKDSITPFLSYKDRCNFILCRTSNDSAKDFQDLTVSAMPLYQIIAHKIKEWNINNNCGAVVGATYPQELKIIRHILGDEMPLLIPGIGKQGGDIEKTVENGTNRKGELAVINSSRGIIFSGDDEHFSKASRDQAQQLRNNINKYRTKH
jgi:orotidine-5'-phosphate decarboxylase